MSCNKRGPDTRQKCSKQTKPTIERTFDTDPMTNAMRESVFVSCVVNDLPRCDVHSGSREVLSHCVKRLRLCLEYNVPNLFVHQQLISSPSLPIITYF